MGDQKDALDAYFLPDAAFIHPLCRVPSFSHFNLPLVGEINSRWAIWMIYRWYKILSPRIVLDVECDEFNQKSSILFVEIRQIFSLFFVPFYKSDVRLTTKLNLVHWNTMENTTSSLRRICIRQMKSSNSFGRVALRSFGCGSCLRRACAY